MKADAGGFVKNPDAVLRGILRRCGVRKGTPHSSGFARLACGAFYEAAEHRQFLDFLTLPGLQICKKRKEDLWLFNYLIYPTQRTHWRL
jgi:hypothetical protein